MPRGTEEWDSQFSERLQVLTKSHLQLFSPKSRTQHLFFSPLSALSGGLSLE